MKWASVAKFLLKWAPLVVEAVVAEKAKKDAERR